MKLTPQFKGRLTRVVNATNKGHEGSPFLSRMVYYAVAAEFEKSMPHEQAKHAARKYLKIA